MFGLLSCSRHNIALQRAQQLDLGIGLGDAMHCWELDAVGPVRRGKVSKHARRINARNRPGAWDRDLHLGTHCT